MKLLTASDLKIIWHVRDSCQFILKCHHMSRSWRIFLEDQSWAFVFQLYQFKLHINDQTWETGYKKLITIFLGSKCYWVQKGTFTLQFPGLKFPQVFFKPAIVAMCVFLPVLDVNQNPLLQNVTLSPNRILFTEAGFLHIGDMWLAFWIWWLSHLCSENFTVIAICTFIVFYLQTLPILLFETVNKKLATFSASFQMLMFSKDKLMNTWNWRVKGFQT